MNIPGNNVPLIGHSNEPVVLRSECVLTPELRSRLQQWQDETGIHMFTLGNVIYTLGVAALSKILNDNKQRSELDGEVTRIQQETGTPED